MKPTLPFRKRGVLNLALDALFLVWAVYFLASGRLVPRVLLWNDQPVTQAVRTHSLDPAAPQLQPTSPDQPAPLGPGGLEGEDGST
jgi:hypothetical protein